MPDVCDDLEVDCIDMNDFFEKKSNRYDKKYIVSTWHHANAG